MDTVTNANHTSDHTNEHSEVKGDENVECSTRVETGRFGFRYVVLALTILCLSCMKANIACFNFTVLCMPGTQEKAGLNKTQYLGYTNDERTWLFSAIAIGSLLSVVPISQAIATYGARQVFFACGILNAISTAFIPMAAHYSLNVFLFLRVVQGICFAANLPTVGSVTAAWASLQQNGLFICCLTTFGQISLIYVMPISGQLCASSYGWEAVYYLNAALTIVFSSVWFCLYSNNPGMNKVVNDMISKMISNLSHHPMVSSYELAEISRGKSLAAIKRSIPYIQILTTPTVLGIWIGAVGCHLALQLVQMFSPLYIREVLQYSVQKTGFAVALPVLFQCLVKVIAGYSSDRIRCISETTKLRIYNSLSLGASALAFCALAFVEKGESTRGMVLITLATAMFGLIGAGFVKCATLVSRQHSHFVLGHIQNIFCSTMLICPVLVSFLLPTGAMEEWRVVFLVHAGLLLLSNAVFCWLATAKPAPWTDASITTSSRRNTPLISRGSTV